MYLKIENLYKQFVTKKGILPILTNINMYVNQGELVSMVGVSGSGKSTLLRIIAGLDFPTAGRVMIENNQIIAPGADRGMVFQSYTLFPWLTVAKNVEFGLKIQGVAKQKRTEITKYYLEMVGLSQFAHTYPKKLSGGMKQRVAIARALACHPKILLMDEPFGALDLQTKENMQELLLKVWQKTHCTILMITHDVIEAVFLSERIYVLSKSPGTIKKEIQLELPQDPDYHIKRHPLFHQYIDEISDLLKADEVAI